MDQSYSPCSICGIFMRKGSQKNKHQNTHTNIFGWQCSVCGGRFDTKRDRKRHENSVHGFHRLEQDNLSKDAVKIRKNQLSKLFNVGFRLVDVQELARSSQASRIRPDNRDATIEELRCIMRSNPQEPKKVSKQSHSTLRAPKREQVEALRLDDSDDENDRWESKSLPEPSTRSIPVSMSISTGFVANNPPQPEEEKEQSKENLVMLELIKKPQFLYYDYKTLHSKFATLPASIWVNSANCELLVIRLDSTEWTGNVDLDGPVCRFTLNDRFGYFVVYAKPGAQHLVQQFTEFTTNFVSFGKFTERVNEMGFRSAVVIANELDLAINMSIDCGGCGKVIEDRFALEVIGRRFHHSCLKCACCNAQLAELSRICYHRDSLLLCLRDYMRLYGRSGVCARCSLIIKPMEYVMHAKTYVFHLSCFACVQCNERFCVGDSYYLYGTEIYCLNDYKALILSLKSQNKLSVVEEEASTSVSNSDSETCP